MNHSQLGSQIVSDDHSQKPRSITGLCLKCSKKNPTLDVKSTLSLLFDGHNVSNFFRPSSSWVKIIGWFSVITHWDLWSGHPFLRLQAGLSCSRQEEGQAFPAGVRQISGRSLIWMVRVDVPIVQSNFSGAYPLLICYKAIENEP